MRRLRRASARGRSCGADVGCGWPHAWCARQPATEGDFRGVDVVAGPDALSRPASRAWCAAPPRRGCQGRNAAFAGGALHAEIAPVRGLRPQRRTRIRVDSCADATNLHWPLPRGASLHARRRRAQPRPRNHRRRRGRDESSAVWLPRGDAAGAERQFVPLRRECRFPRAAAPHGASVVFLAAAACAFRPRRTPKT